MGGAIYHDDDARQAAARQTFSWLVAHALRGATHPISATLAMLGDEPKIGSLTPRQRELLDIASAGVARLMQLSADIQTLTHAEAQTLELHLSLTPVTTLVREAAEQAQQPTLSGSHRSIERRISPAIPPVSCDPQLIRRALAAIIENALRFSPAEAPVTVEARKKRDRIIIQVRDGGPGVAPADVAHLFDPLYVGSRSGSSIGLGLGIGLGLAVARVCVEAHGGSLTLEPTEPPGATFTLELPLAPESTQATSG